MSSCTKDDDETDPSQSGEVLYSNGQIYTVNPNQEWAEAMLVRAVIIAIGNQTDIESLASENAEINDLENKMNMLGIHDVHVHPLEAASDNFQFILNDTETDPENYIFDIHESLAYTVPGIIAHESALKGGISFEIPQFD